MGLSKRLLRNVTKHSISEHPLQGTEGQATITSSLTRYETGCVCTGSRRRAVRAESRGVDTDLPAFSTAWALD